MTNDYQVSTIIIKPNEIHITTNEDAATGIMSARATHLKTGITATAESRNEALALLLNKLDENTRRSQRTE